MVTEFKPKFISEEEILRRSTNAPTLDHIQANYAQIVEEVEAKYGPQVPSLILHLQPSKGRPKTGETVQPVVTKSIKMSPAYWDDLKSLAASDGMTLHSAIRTALIEYSERKHAARLQGAESHVQ